MNHSPLAVIATEAKIGKNVTIDPFAIIEKDVVIGDNCHIYSHSIILNGTFLGNNCQVFPGAVIGGIPQDLKFKGEKTTVEIGDNTILRECVTVNRGTASKGKTVIGNNCLIMAYSHVAHDCVFKDHIIIGNATQIAGEVEIDDYAIVSGGSLVHQFTRISKQVMIQGGSKVGKDVPPYTLIGRDPIVYCGINIVGLRRRGFNNQQVYQIQDIYRTIYNRGLNNSDAIKCIESEYEDTPERNMILDFIKSSQRGIVRGNMD